jgi:CRISPR/Cas system Type II protein with McrA/HNH and RuvC-like nuclease domain
LFFGTGHVPTVDHVIPWSFLLEDDLSDLVLACATCNGKKSDWLPTDGFIHKLIARNRALARNGISMAISESEIDRLYQAAISVEWPRFWPT